MKLLFDQNLSPRLPGRLADDWPGSVHVRSLGFDRASDAAIWEHARENGFCIVTQDRDFSERSVLHGAPPKVIWLRCGNSTLSTVESLLRRELPTLRALQASDRLRCVEIG